MSRRSGYLPPQEFEKFHYVLHLPGIMLYQSTIPSNSSLNWLSINERMSSKQKKILQANKLAMYMLSLFIGIKKARIAKTLRGNQN